MIVAALVSVPPGHRHRGRPRRKRCASSGRSGHSSSFATGHGPSPDLPVELAGVCRGAGLVLGPPIRVRCPATGCAGPAPVHRREVEGNASAPARAANASITPVAPVDCVGRPDVLRMSVGTIEIPRLAIAAVIPGRASGFRSSAGLTAVWRGAGARAHGVESTVKSETRANAWLESTGLTTDRPQSQSALPAVGRAAAPGRRCPRDHRRFREH